MSAEAVADVWRARWPEALSLWSPFVTVRQPVFCLDLDEARRLGIESAVAMIRLQDQTVVVNLPAVEANGLTDFPLEVLAHEIGHHVLAPADLSDNARLLARIRLALPSVEQHAPTVSNLWTDLLINDRLQRHRGLDMAGVYQAFRAAAVDSTTGPAADESRMWTFYLRTYEILWSLVTGTLTRGTIDDRIEADALLASRVARTFPRRMARGGGSFAALCLPYLLTDAVDGEAATRWRVWADAIDAGAGGFPDGLTALDPDGIVHPVNDEEITIQPPGEVDPDRVDSGDEPGEGGMRVGAGQFRQPFDYGEVLRATGLDISDHEAAIRYYRERAIPHLVPFPTQERPASVDPLPEGVESWDAGEPLHQVDWTETLVRSPTAIPGVTTVQRTWGTTEGASPERVPLDLDIYVDSSGSMPNPQQTVSYPALAGAIVALSALRVGAAVQATLWSGTGQFTVTDGFITDWRQVLGVLTGHLGGATAFPLHVLRDTYANRRPSKGPAHVLIVSDDGVDTMFNNDERGEDGRTVSRRALESAGGGGTMALQLFRPIEAYEAVVAAQSDGWDVHAVRGLDDLVAFARAFSRRTYGLGPPAPAAAVDGDRP